MESSFSRPELENISFNFQKRKIHFAKTGEKPENRARNKKPTCGKDAAQKVTPVKKLGCSLSIAIFLAWEVKLRGWVTHTPPIHACNGRFCTDPLNDTFLFGTFENSWEFSAFISHIPGVSNLCQKVFIAQQ